MTVFKDYASKGNVTFDPTTLNTTLADVVELREIWHKMCPEGTFIYFNDTANYYNCSDCDPDC